VLGHNLLYLVLRSPRLLTLLLGLSLIPTGVFAWAMRVECWIATEGVSADAEVTWQREDPDAVTIEYPGGVEYIPKYFVDYRFSPHDDPKHYSPYWLHRLLQLEVPGEDYRRAKRTKKVEILYLPGQPRWNLPRRCDTTDEILFGLGLSLAVNVMFLVGVLAAAHFRRELEEMRFRQESLDTQRRR